MCIASITPLVGDGDFERSSDVPEAKQLITRPCWVQTPGYDPGPCLDHGPSHGPNNEFANKDLLTAFNILVLFFRKLFTEIGR